MTIQETLTAAGGSIWQKNNANRIYLNDSTLVKLLSVDATELKKMKSDKKTTFFCLNTECFYSANGIIIRNALRVAFPKQKVDKI